MPSLTQTWKFEIFCPDLGNNRTCVPPFYFRVKSGLSKLEYRAFCRRFIDVMREMGAPSVPALDAEGKPLFNEDGTPKLVEKEESAAETEARVARELAAFADCLGQAMEMGSEPLQIEGKPVATLAEYVALVASLRTGVAHLMELFDAVVHFNSTEGARALFSGRLSGGVGGTRTPRASGAAPH